MAPTRSTFLRTRSEPALPCTADLELALPKVSRQALSDAETRQRKERRTSVTRQLQRFERRPELSAVEEDHETLWYPLPCCSGNSKPKPYFDVVQKQHPKLHVFEKRVMLIEHGWLYWSGDVTAKKLSLARLHEQTWRGCIDLASTPCHVSAVDGSETLFMLEPLPGSLWSKNDVHSRTRKGTAFVFKARSPQERQNRMHAIYQHMEFEIMPPAPSMPVKPEETTCSVCLGDLGDGRSTCTTSCSHTYHSQCLHQWLAIDGTCPCCRSLLCRPARRPLQPRPTRTGMRRAASW